MSAGNCTNTRGMKRIPVDGGEKKEKDEVGEWETWEWEEVEGAG